MLDDFRFNIDNLNTCYTNRICQSLNGPIIYQFVLTPTHRPGHIIKSDTLVPAVSVTDHKPVTDQLESNHKTVTVQLESDHKTATDNLEPDHKTVTDQLESDDKTATVQLETDHKTVTVQLESDHKTVTVQLETDHKTVTDNLESEHKTITVQLESDHKTTTDHLESDHKTATDHLESDHKTVLADLNLAECFRKSRLLIRRKLKIININKCGSDAAQRLSFIPPSSDPASHYKSNSANS